MSECAINDCNTKKFSRGICQYHYNRWYVGKLDYTPPVKPTECSIHNCNRPPKCLGYCAMHYSRHRSGTPLDQPVEIHEAGRTCDIAGCEGEHAGKGLCMTHWARQKRGHDLAAPVVTRLRGSTRAVKLREYAPAGNSDECWNWTRSTNKGYGVMGVDGKMRAAHIIAWELDTEQELPVGMVIRHSCDNPLCTNPAHLLLGTHADNVADKVARNRQDKGMKHGMSKLTDDQVREIRSRHKAGEWQSTIAEDYGIGQANVSLIVRGKTWTHIT